MFQLALVLPILVCASPSLSAGLERPDPGIGAGFADAMTKQYREAFGLTSAEARCLVYEVMAYRRGGGSKDLSSIEAAKVVADRCGLNVNRK